MRGEGNKKNEHRKMKEDGNALAISRESYQAEGAVTIES